MVALGLALGCGPSVSEGETADGSSPEEATSADDESLEGSGMELEDQGEELPVWPEESLGMYYQDSAPLGNPGMYLFVFLNVELRRDALLVTSLDCRGESSTTQYAVSFEGDEVHVYPEPGETHVRWLGGPWAKELIFRPGPTCRSLVTEIVEPIYSDAEPTWNWLRGAIYVSDTCEEDDDEWGVDLVPGVPTDCG